MNQYFLPSKANESSASQIIIEMWNVFLKDNLRQMF